MQIHTTCRQTKLTPALRKFLEERMARLERYLTVREAHVVLETSKHRQIAEIVLHTRTKQLVCREESRDMTASIEGAIDRLERQLRRLKEKRKTRILHEGTRTNGDEALGAKRSAARAALRGAVAAPGKASAKAKSASARAAAAEAADDEVELPRVVSAKPHAKPLSIEEAALELGGNGGEFLAFINAVTEELNVIYRRKDGNLGLIERAGRRRSRV